jgi:hypothetical protein
MRRIWLLVEIFEANRGKVRYLGQRTVSWSADIGLHGGERLEALFKGFGYVMLEKRGL